MELGASPGPPHFAGGRPTIRLRPVQASRAKPTGVPKSEVGFRIQVTAANSQAEIEQLVDVIGKLAAAFDLRPAQPNEYAA